MVLYVRLLLSIVMLSACRGGDNVPVATGQNWYVRPGPGNYGKGDGKSYDNAWADFSCIDWSLVQPGDTLWLDGTFTTDNLDIGVSGIAGNPVYIRGDYRGTGSPAVIDLSAKDPVSFKKAPIFIFANGTTIPNRDYLDISFIDIKANGAADIGGFQAVGTAGSTGRGFTIKVRNVRVLQNYAVPGTGSGDCFSLANLAQVEFYNITAQHCREMDTPAGSHQAITTHTSSKARVFGGIFDDANYWATPTADSTIELYGVTMANARISGFDNGNDSAMHGGILCDGCTITMGAGDGRFAGGGNGNSPIVIRNSTITFGPGWSSNSPVTANLYLDACTIVIDAVTGGFINASSGIFQISNSNVTFPATKLGYSFFQSNAGGSLVIDRNNTFIANGNRVCRFANSSGGESRFVGNKVTGTETGAMTVDVASGAYVSSMSQNDFYKPGSVGVDDSAFFFGGPPAIACTVMNNIIVGYTRVNNPATLASNLTVDYNDIFLFSENPNGVHTITANPLFVDPANGNFDLMAASPCIGAGKDIGVYQQSPPNIGWMAEPFTLGVTVGGN